MNLLVRPKEIAVRLAAIAAVLVIILTYYYYPNKQSSFDIPESPAVLPQSVLIDLNTAGIDELVILNGIGERLATRIVQLRNKKGGFNKIEDLYEVKGIGRKKLEKIRAFIYAEKLK